MLCDHFFYIVFSFSLVDSSAAEASSSMSQHLRRVWSCPTCHTSMPVTVAEQLQHQSTCAIQEAKSKKCVFLPNWLLFSLCVIRSEAELCRRATIGSCCKRILLSRMQRDIQPVLDRHSQAQAKAQTFTDINRFCFKFYFNYIH